MYLKAVLFCASALFIQTISGQCGCNPSLTLSQPCGCPGTLVYAATPCCLSVSPCQLASAPHIPAGMSIDSDNLLITGPVVVAGRLPFAGTVALEGTLPAYGVGTVSYGCGDTCAIVTEAPPTRGGSCGCRA